LKVEEMVWYRSIRPPLDGERIPTRPDGREDRQATGN
jgi:hypothetical protein